MGPGAPLAPRPPLAMVGYHWSPPRALLSLPTLQCQLGTAKHASLAATMKVEVNFTFRKVEVEVKVKVKARVVWGPVAPAHPTQLGDLRPAQ